MLKRLLFALSLVVIASLATPAHAQLPPVIEGLQNPHFVFGASSLMTDPGPGFKRTNFFASVNVPALTVIRSSHISCALGGVGVVPGTLDAGLSDLQFGFSIPAVTCDINNGQFGFQGGYAKIVSGAEKPDAWYGGLTFSLTSPAQLRHKRAVRDAKKAGKPVPCAE